MPPAWAFKVAAFEKGIDSPHEMDGHGVRTVPGSQAGEVRARRSD